MNDHTEQDLPERIHQLELRIRKIETLLNREQEQILDARLKALGLK